MSARATDAAGNQAVSPAVAVKIDRSAPVAQGVTGGGVTAAQFRTVDWALPSGGSPITKARVRVCTGAVPPAADCQWRDAPLDGPLSFDIGDHGRVASAEVELTDAAGNVGMSAGQGYVRDALPPAAPPLAVDAGAGPNRTVRVTHTDTDIAAYLVRLCKDDSCTEQRAEPSGTIPVTLPSVGQYRVEVRLTDRAGNTSAATSVAIAYPANEVPGAKPTSLKLTTKLPKRLPRTWFKVSGAVLPGSATKVRITLRGTRAGTGRAVSTRKTVVPRASGRWSARLRLPKGISRKKGVRVTVTATPKGNYLPGKSIRRVR